MMWLDICRSPEFNGRWVALDNVRYDPQTTHPLEADVVDADEDLAELCARVRESDMHSCAIRFCDEEAISGPIPRRSSMLPPRAAQH